MCVSAYFIVYLPRMDCLCELVSKNVSLMNVVCEVYVSICVCMCVHLRVCIYVCMRACVSECTNACMLLRARANACDC